MAVIYDINPHEDDVSTYSELAVIRGGITVLPHVQRFADAVEAATGENSFGTYNGHDPTAERAIDCFVPVYTVEPGTSIANFAIANMDRFGIWYLIFRQKIYNPEIGKYWRNMEDRGSPTQNHFDHVHLSFYESAAEPVPVPAPKPAPIPQLEVESLFIFDGPKGVGGIWYTDGYYKWGVPNEDSLVFWREGGVKHLGTVDKDTFYALRLRNDGIVDNPGVG